MKTRTAIYQPPAFTAASIADLAEHALAGDVVQCQSVEECAELVAELKRRGHPLKRRTEWEEKHVPWTFLTE